MIQHILEGNISISPKPDGGKQISVHAGVHVYHLPLNEESTAELLEWLALPNDELAERIVRREASAKLLEGVPQHSSNGHGPELPADLLGPQA